MIQAFLNSFISRTIHWFLNWSGYVDLVTKQWIVSNLDWFSDLVDLSEMIHLYWLISVIQWIMRWFTSTDLSHKSMKWFKYSESIRHVLDSVMFRSIQHSMNHLKSDSARGVNTSKAQNDALCLCRDYVQLHAEHIQLVIHTSKPLSRCRKIHSSQNFDDRQNLAKSPDSD